MVISTAYFPPVSYIEALRDGAMVEACENFQKHSPRNRARIMTASGVLTLSVPLVGGRGVRGGIKEIQVDNNEAFAREHLKSVVTAYRSAPYFEHYIDGIEKLISEKYRFLFDKNCAITEYFLRLFKLPSTLSFTTEFCGTVEPNYDQGAYYQVFSDRQPFVENLSILDYLFCCGARFQR